MPHGHCYLWQPGLVGSMAISDFLIGLAYCAISASLWYLVRRARVPFSRTFIAFGVFIAACGAGHWIDVVTIWHPIYWVSAGFRIVTAMASVTTAVATFLLIPRILEATAGLRVSEQRRRMLEASQERFRILVDGVKEYAIFMMDASGRIESWNAGAARIKGYTADEVMGQPLEMFFLPEDRAKGLPAEILKQAADQGQCEGEGWRVRKDGSRFYSSYVLTALKGPDGELRGYSKVTRDVTDKKKAADALRAAYEDLERRVRTRTEELVASQREYQELVNTVDGIVWEAEIGKPRYTFVSRQAERILGYPIERWMSQDGFWQEILLPEDRERLTGAKYRSPLDREDSRIEYRVRTADGRLLWIRDYIRVIHPANSATSPTKLRGLMVDITLQKQVEEELRSAQDAALQAARAKSDFLANISHEIRTPLNAIAGMADIALDDTLDEESRERMATIRSAADSLLGLINEILDLSKVEAGKIELELSDFRLAAIARNAIEVAAPIGRKKSIDLGLQLDPRLPECVRGDPGRVLQVLLNLIGNAIKFTGSGGSVQLSIRPAQGGKDASPAIRFEVRDNGIGLTEETRKKLFQPFTQADSSTARKYGGSGLGLSISKRLVELMGGRIDVESSAGQGSLFWFEVPLPPAVAAQTSAASHESLSRLAPLPKVRILVAEDNLANQKVIRRFLEKLGQTPEIVSDGREAVDRFETGAFDLVLMDCQMPEMDGYAAAERIRAEERKRGRKPTPIVALTAHALSGDEEKCRASGMNGYLRKPVSLKLLSEAISQYAGIPGPKAAPAVRDDRTEPDAELPTLDLEYIRGLDALEAPGQPDIVLELIGCFEKSGPEKISTIRAALSDSDLERVRREAHHFKSTCFNVGAKRLAEICRRIEESAGARSAPAAVVLPELSSLMSREFERTHDRLRELARERAKRGSASYC